MDVTAFVADIQRQLDDNVDPSPKVSPDYYFKEEVKYHGVKALVLRRIAAERYHHLEHLGKASVFAVCTALFETGYGEEAGLACEWAYRSRAQFELADFEVFEDWLSRYVDNWAKCDTLCNHTIAAFLDIHPDYVQRIKAWTKSENRWLRRAAAVTLILPARRGKLLKDVFEIADSLLGDKDDLVQKGYGWMLKEASRLHQQEVFGYVMSKKAVMPRTALRYAIEKMPEDLRRRAMAK